MLAAESTTIGLSLSLVLGTVFILSLCALMAWLVFVVVPRHLTDRARHKAVRR